MLHNSFDYDGNKLEYEVIQYRESMDAEWASPDSMDDLTRADQVLVSVTNEDTESTEFFYIDGPFEDEDQLIYEISETIEHGDYELA